jgi:DNA-binding protein H-NS
MTTSLQDLLDQKSKLERQIADIQKASRNEAIACVRALMAEHGVTVEDLVAAKALGVKRPKGPQSTGRKVAAKYRNPETGTTWSGRGLKPKWLAQAIADGRQVSDFAI